MKQILRDDLEIEIDKTGEEGLFAEFEHEDILKKLTGQRELETRNVKETLVLDQTAQTGRYCISEVLEVGEEEDLAGIIRLGIKRIIEEAKQKNICDFCGAENSTTNRVVNGPEKRICQECLRLCREVLDEEGAL